MRLLDKVKSFLSCRSVDYMVISLSDIEIVGVFDDLEECKVACISYTKAKLQALCDGFEIAEVAVDEDSGDIVVKAQRVNVIQVYCYRTAKITHKSLKLGKHKLSKK